MNNIILIGMSGAGKSTLGVLLAKRLRYGFVDTDLLIQEREEASLQSIIDTQGTLYFKQVEEAVLCHLASRRTIVATGGSAVYSQKGMEALKGLGHVVYLKVAYPVIAKRLQNISGRGIVMEAGKTLKEVYVERERLYSQYADTTVLINQEGIEETIDSIVNKLGGV